ncbi:MAG TPA: hypothetical protein VE591_08675 [Candidatus Acidoferrum sp.]|nr:hypothetical protein [Candidatus Acidoferrum sp.]
MALLAIVASAGLLATVQVPPFAIVAQETTLSGTIAGFDGKYHLRLRDDRGYVDDVTLHQGTVITPTGQRLHPGMRVTIRGAAAGSTFDADEIDVAADETSSDSQDYSPGPYTPLFGPNGIPCNTGDCLPYGYGGYGGGYYGPGYYPGSYPSYYIPYYVPSVIVVPAPQPTSGSVPAPFHLRRPLNAPQLYAVPPQPLPHGGVAPVPHAIAPPPEPVRRAPAPPAVQLQPHAIAVPHAVAVPHAIAVPHVVGPHR